MDSLRVAPIDEICRPGLCCRCVDFGPWDRIASKGYCPNCQEMLALGDAPPLVERANKRRICAVCGCRGTVCYATLPLNSEAAVEMDLCGEHLRALLSRGLGPHAYHQLHRQLQAVGVAAEDVFLLHEAFYDSNGRALQPAVGPE